MADSTPAASHFSWKTPLCASLLVIGVYVAMAFWAADSEFFASILFVAPALILVSICFIIFAVTPGGRQSRLTLLSTVPVLWLTAVAMFLLVQKYDFAMRTTARWLIRSRKYKAEVLAQPNSTSGYFKHIEWDGWGFVPAGDTTAYLVFDPSDSLSAAARSHRPGKYSGIPCEVPEVNRLEKEWYTVVFYTDEDWTHCN
ncbi:MAG TPA: hypothetical protein VMD77_08045 [Candidatus Baltobacteraceae bacterium]|nr:hypothetical protein [Candidatus Baltobacteraceae bacterium]